MRLDKLIKRQHKLAQRVRIKKIHGTVQYIAGVDVAQKAELLFGCIGVFEFPSLYVVDEAFAQASSTFPYIPGFLSFREIPVIVKTYKKLRKKPDLILVDGQGIAHPRRLGLASHVGVMLGVATIGCAKSHLYGDYTVPRLGRGRYTYIRDGKKRIGIVLRTRKNVRPLFVSPGNLVDMSDCRNFVLASTTKYRIPEPLRYAHTMAREKARELGSVDRWSFYGTAARIV
ncbi:MAG: endonuclease V [candidate division WOR-3 bacterium]|nr:MAG: endonuclease V [candidate division WOR-3 bacterium]